MALVRCRGTPPGREASRMPTRKNPTSLAVDGPLRDEAATAAERAGMPVGQWLERALRMALDGEAEPEQPEGVEIGELEAMVRRVVSEELRPVREALGQLEMGAMVPNPAGGGPITPTRERVRQRRAR